MTDREFEIKKACFNNASTLLSGGLASGKNSGEIADGYIKKVTLDLYEEMNDWLRTGDKKEERTCVECGKADCTTVHPPPPTEAPPEEDLPF